MPANKPLKYNELPYHRCTQNMPYSLSGLVWLLCKDACNSTWNPVCEPTNCLFHSIHTIRLRTHYNYIAMDSIHASTHSYCTNRVCDTTATNSRAFTANSAVAVVVIVYVFSEWMMLHINGTESYGLKKDGGRLSIGTRIPVVPFSQIPIHGQAHMLRIHGINKCQ